MPRTKGALGRRTVAVSEAVENAFRKVNKGNRYLLRLAEENPQLFVQLLCRSIPQAVAVDVQITALDLGLAMRQASERLNVVDVTPDNVSGATTRRLKSPPAVAGNSSVEPDEATPDKVKRHTRSGAKKSLKHDETHPGGGWGAPPKV